MVLKTSFSCGSALDIEHVLALYARLQRSLKKSTVIILTSDAVVKADTAGLQLILSFIREVENRGGKVIWKNPSAALLGASRRLGIDMHIGLTKNQGVSSQP